VSASEREGWVVDSRPLRESRSAPRARACTSTAATRSIIEASACRQLSLNKSFALHAINQKLIANANPAAAVVYRYSESWRRSAWPGRFLNLQHRPSIERHRVLSTSNNNFASDATGGAGCLWCHTTLPRARWSKIGGVAEVQPRNCVMDNSSLFLSNPLLRITHKERSPLWVLRRVLLHSHKTVVLNTPNPYVVFQTSVEPHFFPV